MRIRNTRLYILSKKLLKDIKILGKQEMGLYEGEMPLEEVNYPCFNELKETAFMIRRLALRDRLVQIRDIKDVSRLEKELMKVASELDRME